jgi:hypothetical protein
MSVRDHHCKRRFYDWNPVRSSRESDYAYARGRSGRALPDARRYELARDIAKSIASKRRKNKQALEGTFRQLVAAWKSETGHLSSMRKAVGHDSYLRIIGLAKDSFEYEIERLLLCELESEPDYWFAALRAITGEDPVKPNDDFDDAVAAWLDWGKQKGII